MKKILKKWFKRLDKSAKRAKKECPQVFNSNFTSNNFNTFSIYFKEIYWKEMWK